MLASIQLSQNELPGSKYTEALRMTRGESQNGIICNLRYSFSDHFPLLPGYQEVTLYWSQLAGYHYLWLLKPPSQIEATVL